MENKWLEKPQMQLGNLWSESEAFGGRICGKSTFKTGCEALWRSSISVIDGDSCENENDAHSKLHQIRTVQQNELGSW